MTLWALALINIMLNDLLKCSVWIIKSQLDGSYVPGISLLHEDEQTLYFVIMPPTSKKLEGHIASGLFVRPSVRHAF